ncbi:MAG: DUF3768 domain-containing protein [Aquisalinus sp.]|nr:DUF3768 domain-containing protein [Aquisalinus sp.]
MRATTRIAELNDQLRNRVGVPVFLKPGAPNLGTVLFTRGVMALEPEQIIDVWAGVRNFRQFTEDNDPYHEHDFGSFTLDDGTKIFWKIDYYADETCLHGSEDPSDPEQCFRVLTVMLANEY